MRQTEDVSLSTQLNQLTQQNSELRHEAEVQAERVQELQEVVASLRTAAVVGGDPFRPSNESAVASDRMATVASRVQAVVRGHLFRSGWVSQLQREVERARRASADAQGARSKSCHFAEGIPHGASRGSRALPPPRRPTRAIAEPMESRRTSSLDEDVFDSIFDLQGALGGSSGDLSAEDSMRQLSRAPPTAASESSLSMEVSIREKSESESPAAAGRKRMLSYRERKSAKHRLGCWKRNRMRVKRWLDLEVVDSVVATYSLIYLLVIVGELVLADVNFAINASAERCGAPNATDGGMPDELASSPMNERVFIIIDFCFICVFLFEVSLRMFATGSRYFLHNGQVRWLNLIDLGVILASLVIDVLTLFPSEAFSSMPPLFFMRLGRLLRVVRIFNVISRVSRSRRRYRRRRKRALARILAPPRCDWTSARRADATPAKPFACFLSHFKAEAGSDARYLYDLLASITETSVYLDSTRLTDLHTLFTEGVHKSEVIVLLATENVLTRPWCLLELYEAGRLGIPVIPLGLEKVHRTPHTKPKFDLLEARHFLNNLETMLELANPGALADLNAHLAAESTPLHKFKDGVLEALGIADPRVERVGAPKFPTWHSGGTDAQLLADVKDLVLAMADATGRQLHWTGEEDHINSVTLSSCIGSVCEMCRKCTSKDRADSYSVFIACDPVETSDVARYLQGALTRRCPLPVVQEIGPEVDETSIDDVLTLGIGRSHALLLLLSGNVLARPWTLLQIYEAIRLERPLVCVEVQGRGYAHAEAREWLKNLRVELDSSAPGATAEIRRVLHARGASFSQMQAALSAVLPSIIAITFTPDGSQNHVDAVLVDVCERLIREKQLSKQSSFFSLRHSEAIRNHRSSVEAEDSMASVSHSRQGTQTLPSIAEIGAHTAEAVVHAAAKLVSVVGPWGTSKDARASKDARWHVGAHAAHADAPTCSPAPTAAHADPPSCPRVKLPASSIESV